MPKTSGGRHASIIGLALGALATYALGASVTPGPLLAAPAAVETAFTRFWNAPTSDAAGKVASDVVASGVSFDEAFARLRAGRTYSATVPRDIVKRSRQAPSGQFFYALNVPTDYDPQRRYQVRFQLHGGVSGRLTSEPRGDGSIGALAGAEQIYIIPYAWKDAPWWNDQQIENLRAILDSVKRTYNVDENRVVLAGVSDGATGSYYFAMRDTTPFASFVSLNGFMMVLASPRLNLTWDLFPHNLLNKPYFMVNGGLDRLYPARAVEPFIDHLKKGGVAVDYHPQYAAEHNTRWWPQLKDTVETFVREHPRDPLPARLTWHTTGAEESRRAHWLVINRVTARPTMAEPLPDLNQFTPPTASGQGDEPRELFFHPRPFGRVDLVRTGNVVEAVTRNVAEFTLLLSPDAFDFSQPIKVVANGRVLFEGRVEKSLETLLTWAARDNDRTMLFGAELHLKVQ